MLEAKRIFKISPLPNLTRNHSVENREAYFRGCLVLATVDVVSNREDTVSTTRLIVLKNRKFTL